MPQGAACLLDSNILLRLSKSDEVQRAIVSKAILRLFAQVFAFATPPRRWASIGTWPHALKTRTASVRALQKRIF